MISRILLYLENRTGVVTLLRVLCNDSVLITKGGLVVVSAVVLVVPLIHSQGSLQGLLRGQLVIIVFVLLLPLPLISLVRMGRDFFAITPHVINNKVLSLIPEAEV